MPTLMDVCSNERISSQCISIQIWRMIGLDRARRLVHLAANCDDEGRLITPERSVGYDTLVIAIGSVGNDFGTPGVNEYAIRLDTPEQAQRFNPDSSTPDCSPTTQAESVRPGQLHVAIIGAGATGTELSAELHRIVRGVVAFGLDKIDPDKDIKIT
jgi:NADH dehydrogenase